MTNIDREHPPPPAGHAVTVDVIGLAALMRVLTDQGYRIAGPTVRDGAIVVAELDSVDDLPFGWGVQTGAGRYRLHRRQDNAAFAHSAGPQSWKNVLHPPRARLWSADLTEGTVRADDADPPRYALLGVRPCDVRAIGALDRVLTGGAHVDPVYHGRRDGAFIVAVECTEPGAACFCASMGCGPDARTGFDLAMTEMIDDDGHWFLVRAATAAGAEVLAQVPSRPADSASQERAATAVGSAGQRMGRTLVTEGLPGLLAGSRESPHWDDVATRCLTCGNCTLVCPTCFCTTVEDVTDLTGDHAERWRSWDSCFALDFTYLHGGSVRVSGRSRYRQWLNHKLGTWHDQFGESGCVGCGRCIVWCPAGIDITQEASALRSLDQHPPAAASAGTPEDTR